MSPWNNSDFDYHGETEQSISKEKFIVVTQQDEKINFIKPNINSQFYIIKYIIKILKS